MLKTFKRPARFLKGDGRNIIIGPVADKNGQILLNFDYINLNDGQNIIRIQRSVFILCLGIYQNIYFEERKFLSSWVKWNSVWYI